jgi:nicotinamidase-related amidase
MKALLIIDMQKGCFNPYSACHDTVDVIDRINSLSAQFREQNQAVLFIQHDGSYENCLIPDTDDWQLLPELIQHSSDFYVHKTANDSFYQTTLQEILEKKGVQELYITGSATDFCINATVHSALSKDYKVTVVADAHTTEHKPDLDAQTLIAHYNWVWSMLAPTTHAVTVATAADVCRALADGLQSSNRT